MDAQQPADEEIPCRNPGCRGGKVRFTLTTAAGEREERESDCYYCGGRGTTTQQRLSNIAKWELQF